MRKQNMRRKLIIGALILFFLTLFHASLQYLLTEGEHNILRKINNLEEEKVKLSRVRYYHQVWVKEIENLFITGNIPQIFLDNNKCNLGEWLLAYPEKEMSGEKLKRLKELHRKIHNNAIEVIKLAKEGQRKEALKLFSSTIIIDSNTMDNFLVTLDEDLSRQLNGLEQKLKRRSTTMKFFLVLLVLFVAGLMFLVIMKFDRDIVLPLTQISDRMLKVEKGEFSYLPGLKKENVVSNLINSFNQMLEYIRMEKLSHDLLEKILAVDNMDRVLQEIVSTLVGMQEVSFLAIYLYTEEEDRYFLAASNELTSGQKKYLDESGLVNKISLSKEISIDNNIPVYTKAISAIGIPINNKESVLGLLIIGSYKEFNQIRVDMLKQFTYHLGIAIDNVYQRGTIKRVSKAKNEFLATISHELRTPLNSILGFSELLESEMPGPINEKQREYVENIRQGGQKLLSLVNDILDISRVERENLYWEPGVFNLKLSIQNILLMVKKNADEKDITIHNRLEGGLEKIRSDEKKIKQIIYNLLSNAIKFTPEQGEVWLRIMINDDHLNIEVEDDGIGIPEDKIDVIFQPFFQLDSSLNRKYEGMGLGLSLVKRLVELGGGNIKVKSKVGEGSLFQVTIPLQGRKKGGEIL